MSSGKLKKLALEAGERGVVGAGTIAVLLQRSGSGRTGLRPTNLELGAIGFDGVVEA